MIIFIDALEAIWIVTNALAIIGTLFGLRYALADRNDVRRINGGASRTIVAQGDVRRERLRLLIQTVMLFVVAPGLFESDPTLLSFPVVLLSVVPPVLLLNTLFDLRDRRRLTRFAESDISAERAITAAADAALKRLAKEAQEAADRVRAAASVTALELVAASPSTERGVAAAERTADATERIADAAGPNS